MAIKYVLSSLDVGQGMCTFFECCDSSNKVLGNALIDFGSSNPTSIKKLALDFLVERIKERSKPSDNGYLDIVLLSHKDKDHTNLIRELLDELPKATVGRVRYGGRKSWYKKSDGNILDKLGGRTKDADTCVKGFPIGHSNYNPQIGDWAPIFSSYGYSLYLIAANTPCNQEKVGDPETKIPEQPDGNQVNCKSLVVMLAMGRTKTVVGGDATFPTFQYVNGFFNKEFTNNVMTLLPHHGSRRTTFGLGLASEDISDENRKVVDTYAKRMNGKTVVASADVTSHNHPSLETIDVFREYTDDTKTWWLDPRLGTAHYLTAYIDPSFAAKHKIGSGYGAFQTDANVYSTRYYSEQYPRTFSYPPYKKVAPKKKIAAFPNGMNWIYRSDSDSDATTLVGEDNQRLGATFARLLRQDFVPGEPLPEEPRLLPPAAATVSIRAPANGGARAAVTQPRAASSFSRLVSVS